MKKWLLGLALLALAAVPAAACTGSTCFWVGGSGTWDNTNTGGGGTGGIKWANTSGGASGGTVPGSGDTVTFDANSCASACTITVLGTGAGSTITVASINCTALTNSAVLDFSANNNNVTMSGGNGFNCSGTGTRTLNLGSGTFTISSAAAGFNIGTITGLIFNANTSTILFTAANCTNTFTGGGLTYNAVTFSCASGNNNPTVSNAAGTIGTLTYNTTGTNSNLSTIGSQTFTTWNMNATTSGVNVTFTNGTTITANNMNFNDSSSFPIILTSNSGTVNATLSSSTNKTLNWLAAAGITFTGGGTWTLNNSFNVRGNSGATINPPSGGGFTGIIGG